MRDAVVSSPTLSCSSADDALYELLGTNKLSLDQEEEEKQQNESPPSALVSCLTPPTCCHRPHTPHDALLLVCPQALSACECRYIIKKGNQATNDGGHHYGPNYVKEAAHGNHHNVTLQRPNHHKVCVFMDTMIQTWLERVVKNHFHEHFQKWNDTLYIVNPRLRLLRYDAVDKDVFLSHYDATTTCTRQGVEYESKLTILLYLNTDFVGGETAFLNSLNPSDFINIAPKTGQVVVFNHELYHASRELQYSNDIEGKDTIVAQGGTKFVLRSDVMFEKKIEEDPCTTSILEIPSSDVVEVKVADVLAGMKDNSNKSTLADVLDQLDFLNASVRTFLVPGQHNLTTMLVDLGVEQDECEAFLVNCEATLEGTNA